MSSLTKSPRNSLSVTNPCLELLRVFKEFMTWKRKAHPPLLLTRMVGALKAEEEDEYPMIRKTVDAYDVTGSMEGILGSGQLREDTLQVIAQEDVLWI